MGFLSKFLVNVRRTLKDLWDGCVAILDLQFKVVREQFRQVLAVVVVVVMDIVQEEDKPVAEVHATCLATSQPPYPPTNRP